MIFDKSSRYLSIVRKSHALNSGVVSLRKSNMYSRQTIWHNIREISCYPDEEEVLMMIADNWILWMRLCRDNNYELKTFFDRMKKEFCGTNKAILGHFGNVFRSMGKCDDAEKYYRRLLKELSENHHRIFPAVTADLELSLAVKANTSKVRNIIEKLFTSLNEWIGNVSLTSVVAWVQALHFYEIALDMHRQIVGIDHTHAAICFGNIYQEKKNYSKALDYHQKALNRWEQSLRVHHYHLGSLHDNIGNVYYYLKQCDRALQHYRQSLDVKSKSLLDYHPSIASTLKKYWQSV
ncbi:unnamed protein product [Adineta ricciae]|uniref:Tetratricopeptide repeat protein n=1 Tax=Adineta ricciae TaxID=249248 RepID=A0A814TQB4_ADIRI|nr:unnamed protein product [Adineta ricciae]